MIKTLVVLAILIALSVAYLAYQGAVSRAGVTPGLRDDKLRPCGPAPNCVCSECPDDTSHFAEPLPLPEDGAAEALRRLRLIVAQLGGKIEIERKHYLAATFKSRLFGFVDDVEFRIDADRALVHLRSAARVGYGDLGANRKRIEQIRNLYAGGAGNG